MGSFARKTHQKKTCILGGLGAIASIPIAIFKDYLFGMAGESAVSALPVNASTFLVQEILPYVPALLVFVLGISAIMGWGTNTTVHLSRPYFRREKPVSASAEEPPVEVLPSPLISLTDLMREAQKQGWRFTDDGSQHIFDFVHALRDAGSTRGIQFWGRIKQRIDSNTKYKALEEIPSTYWSEFKLDGLSMLNVSPRTGEAKGIVSDNLKTTTEADGNLTQHGLYADIHLDRNQAVNWLKSQRIVPARIRMTDAAVRAYEATQDTSIAERSEKSGSGVKVWYAMALTKDENIKLYGHKPPSRNLVEIPRSDVEAFMFENDANELVDQFDDGNRYVNLEVLEADFLRSLEKIKREAG